MVLVALSMIFAALLLVANVTAVKIIAVGTEGIDAGILAYPFTFLISDVISEIYGRRKANQVVTAGLIASLFMLIVVTIADLMPATVWSPVSSDTFHNFFGLSGAAVFA